MWRFLPLLLAGFLAVSPSAPQETPEALTQTEIAELTLDELFERLPDYAETDTGRAIEVAILERFHESGSDTADLLMSWALLAMEREEYPLALDVLDQVILIKPDFAEGWNKRATVYFLLDDYAASLADIRQTLALEPRHFGALAGLGMILESTGHEDRAMEVFRRALEINPQMEKVRETLERLERANAGNSI
jgi:tetratricopeptide (TPR) repeat protein